MNKVNQKSLDMDDVKSKISPLPMSSASSDKKPPPQTSYELNLIQENLQLRGKIDSLEDKCKQLESRLASSQSNSNSKTNKSKVTKSFLEDSIDHQQQQRVSEPKPELHAPIRVRLQKLSEKTVALKWNHNPKNIFVQLAGYRIYINGELCGTMKPTDVSASIDGIQVEGEYKICVRSFVGPHESLDSNQVITRVKKTPPAPPPDTDSKTGTSELSTSSNESDYGNEDTSENSSVDVTSKHSSNKSRSEEADDDSVEKKLNAQHSKEANVTLENITVSPFVSLLEEDHSRSSKSNAG